MLMENKKYIEKKIYIKSTGHVIGCHCDVLVSAVPNYITNFDYTSHDCEKCSHITVDNWFIR